MSSDTVVITQDLSTPTAEAGVAPGVLDCDTLTLTLDGTGSTTTDVNYLWTGGTIDSGATTLSPVISAPGTYTLTVTNTITGCISSDTVVITQDLSTPTAEAGVAPGVLDCDTLTLTLDGTGSTTTDVSYVWTGGTIDSGATTLSPVISAPGTYTLTVTNTITGCISSDTVVITQDLSTPTAEAGVAPGVLDCDTSTLTLDGTGSTTTDVNYLWTGGTIDSGATTLSPVISAPGTYTLTVTNTITGCISSDTVVITQDLSTPTAEAGVAPGVLDCDTSTLTLDGTGSTTTDVSYVWTGGTIDSGATTLSPVISAPGTYTLTVTNTITGCISSDTVVITQDLNTPTAEAGVAPGVLDCDTSTLTLDGTGSTTTDVSYVWTGGAIDSGATTLSPVISAPGTYTLTVTNTITGCISSDTVVITQDLSTPTAEAGVAPGVLDCDTLTLTLNGIGSTTTDVNYLWTGGTIDSGATTLSPVISVPGTYTLTVTNTITGCISSDTVVITQDLSTPTAEAGVAPGVLDCDTLTLTLNGIGSTTTDVNYLWTGGSIDSGATTLSPVISAPGTYTLTVTNTITGCISSDTVVITQDLSTPTAEAGVAPGVLDCDTLTLTLDGTGSTTTDVSYVWTGGTIDSGATTLSPVISAPGTYTLTVTNTITGCISSDTVVITQDLSTPTAEAGVAPGVLDCDTLTLTLDGTGSTTTDVSYVWTGGTIDSGATTLSPVISAPGTYTLTVTNTITGCISSDTVVITQDLSTPTAEAGVAPGVLDCDTLTLTLNGIGSTTTDVNYLWTGGSIDSGATTLSPVISAPGTYTLTVTNTITGCISSDTVVITQDLSTPTAEAGVAPGVLDCDTLTLTLDGTGSTTTDVSYVWTGGTIDSGATTLSPVISAPGTYTLTVTNTTTGCMSSDTVVITQDLSTPTAEAGVAPGVLDCDTLTLTLDGTGSTTTDVSYVWTGGTIDSGATTLSPVISAPGTYTLTVTNTTTGCMSSDTVVITQDLRTPTAEAGVAPGVLDCDTLTLILDGTGSTTTDVSYVWTGGTIDSGATTLSPVISVPGTYTLTVTNTTTGCMSSDTVVITQDLSTPTAEAGVAPGVLDCDTLTLTLDGTGSTTTDVSYVWTGGTIDSGATTLSPVISAPGTYTLTVTNTITGCISSDTVVITQDLSTPTAEAGVAPGVLDCDTLTLTLDGTGSTTTDVSYVWTGGAIDSGATTLSPVISAPGTYTLTVTNTITGCISSDTVVITQDLSTPTAEAGVAPGVLDCDTLTLTLDGTGSTTTDVSYVWTGGTIDSGATTLSPVISAPGTYTLTVTNTITGCVSSDTVVITQDLSTPTAEAGVAPGVLDCDTLTLTLDGTGSTTTDVSYVWTGGTIDSGATTLSPVISAPGTYTLTVTNTITGCISSDTVVITQDLSTPTAEAGVAPGVLDCDTSTLTLDGTGSTTTDVNYLWTGGTIDSGATTLSPVISAPGTYTLTVTNTITGCISSDTVVITQDLSTPTAEAGVAPGVLDCDTSTLTLDGTGSTTTDVSYVWTGGTIDSGATTLSPVISAPGTYTLTVTNTITGCISSDTVVITQDLSTPTAEAGVAPGVLDCDTLTLTLDGTGSTTTDVSYVWTGGTIDSGATTLSPVISAPGTYTLTVINTITGCISSDTVVITQDLSTPTAEAGVAPGVLDCDTLTLTLDGIGSTTTDVNYLWTGGTIDSGATTLSPVISAPGIYTLTVTNTIIGCISSDTVVITQDLSTPTAEAGVAPGVLDCDTLTLTLDGTGSTTTDVSYVWTGGTIDSGATTLSPVISAPGTYTLTVTNTITGCISSDTVVITQDLSTPTAEAGVAPGVLDCDTLTLTLDGTGSTTTDVSYVWTGGTIDSGATTLSPVISAPGTYTLTVTNTITGCISSDTVVITQDLSTPTAEAGVAPGVLDCDTLTLTLDGTGSTTTDVSYVWTGGTIDSGATTLSPVISAPGTYTLTITNTITGCISSDTVVITQDLSTPTAEAGVAPGVLDCDTLTLTLDGTGSTTTDVNYLWTGGTIDSGATTLSPVISAPGTYTLTVTNTITGCISSDTVVITQDLSTPTAEAGVAPGVLDCDTLTLTLDGTGSTTTNVSYVWTGGTIDSGATTLSPVISAPGTYTLTVTNTITGCISSDTVVITQDLSTPTAEAGVAPGVLDCDTLTLTLDGTGSTTTDVSYVWTGGAIDSGATTLSPVISAPGTYTLTVTNTITGCISSDTVVITQDLSTPTAEAGVAPGVLDCDTSTLTLDGTGSTTTDVNYLWTGGTIDSGATTLSPVISAPGTYTLTVTNTITGCISSDTVVITQDLSTPTAEAGVAPGVLDCDTSTLTLDGTGSTTTDVNYLWTGGTIDSGATTLSPVISAPGTYTLTVTNTITGCISSDTVVITQDLSTPTAEAGVAPGVLDCDTLTLTLDGTGSTTTDVSYVWTGGTIDSGATTLSPVISAPGTYTLTVINTITGCISSDTVVITQDLSTPTAEAGVAPGVLDCDTLTLTLDGIGSTTTDVNYLWTGGTIDSGATTLSPVISAPGIYTLTVTNTIIGCISSDTVVITQDLSTPTAEAGVAPGVLDCDTLTLTLDGTGSTTTDVSYVWTGGTIDSGATTLSPVISAPGTYTLTVTNTITGCISSDTVVITQDLSTPTAEAGVAPGVLDCDTLTLTLDGTGSTTTDVSYVWTGGTIDSGATTLSPVISAPGTYTLTVTNTITGCISSDTVVITQDLSTPTAEAGVAPGVLDCDTLTLTLDGTGSTTTDVSYVWTGGTIDSGATTLSPVISAPGTYTLTITNTITGCISSDTVVITQDLSTPTAEAGVAPGVLDCDTLTLTLDGTGSTTTDVNYLWTGGTIDSGATTLSPVISAPGTYTLTVTNTITGCISSDTVVITQDLSTPTAEAGVAPGVLDCDTLTLTLDGTGSTTTNVSYVWTGGTIDSGATTLSPVISAPGTYTLTVTNTITGCISSDTVVITQDLSTPTAEAGVAPGVLDCDTLTLTLDGTGSTTTDVSYVWTGGAIDSGATTLSPVISAPGTYTLTVTNTITGCISSDTVVITQDLSTPTAEAGVAPGVLDCDTSTLTLDGTGSTTTDVNYLWTGGTIDSGATTLSPVISAPGTYTLTVTNTITGCISSDTVVITQDLSTPTAEAGVAPGVLDCDTSTLTLDGTGSTTTDVNYLWTGGTIDSGATTLSPVISAPGTYTLTVTNTITGCISSDTVVITQDLSTPTAEAGVAPGVLDCDTSTLTLDGTGSTTTDVSYVWTGGTIDSGATTLSPVISAPGTYTLTVTNTITGCISSDTVVITQDLSTPTAEAGVAPGVLDCDTSTLTLDGTGSTTTDVSYVWTGGAIDSGATTLSPVISAPGTYTLTVTNTITGCISSDTVVVTQDLSTPIPPNVSEQLFCSIETPTGNDLVPTISNTVIWFKDSALTKILDTVEFLEEGTYYVVSKNIDTGCLSPAISVKITLRGSLDTDGDGLTDCEETTGLDDPLTIGVPTSISNPNNSCSFTGKPKPDTQNTIWQLSDCDGDNEINGDEIVNETNPNDPCSVSIKTVPDINNPNYLIWAQQDCDGDGVLNSNEVMDDTSPFDPCDFVPSSISEPITSNIKCISAIEVTKTASLTDKEVGDIIEYTIKVENIGTSTIMNISLSDIFTDIDGNPLELTEGVRFDGADYGSPEGTLLMGEAAIYKASFIITKEVINTGGVRNTVIAVGQDSSGELVEDISDDGDDTDGNIKDDPTVTDLGCLIVFNQFTPNNDDHNDVFIINCIKNYPKNTLEIFNRWGNTVYKKVGYDNSWDGISTGRATLEEEIKLPVGTYFYILDLGDGSEVKKGWIYINR
ncbi:conserved protein of unknown function precursor containing a T9SS type B C-terminal secretion signal [Tenacibaculum sp. 190524A02b]|uniref:T9SS type B sorting domain-containing protein n=1 Tax=Tenacibaculum vairaonense TaxID=3137860 RepID=UPI0032B26E00